MSMCATPRNSWMHCMLRMRRRGSDRRDRRDGGSRAESSHDPHLIEAALAPSAQRRRNPHAPCGRWSGHGDAAASTLGRSDSVVAGMAARSGRCMTTSRWFQMSTLTRPYALWRFVDPCSRGIKLQKVAWMPCGRTWLRHTMRTRQEVDRACRAATRCAGALTAGGERRADIGAELPVHHPQHRCRRVHRRRGGGDAGRCDRRAGALRRGARATAARVHA